MGDWIRTNEEADKQTFEYWSKISDIEYKGLGCTLKDNDTIFKENLTILKVENDWFFEVTGVNEAPTRFKITNLKLNGFTSENNQNPFPKNISYNLKGKELEATIGDSVTVIPFIYKKIK